MLNLFLTIIFYFRAYSLCTAVMSQNTNPDIRLADSILSSHCEYVSHRSGGETTDA
jgi:hypothetical protein